MDMANTVGGKLELTKLTALDLPKESGLDSCTCQFFIIDPLKGLCYFYTPFNISCT